MGISKEQKNSSESGSNKVTLTDGNRTDEEEFVKDNKKKKNQIGRLCVLVCVCVKEEREMKGSGRNKKGDRVDILSTFRVWVGRREEKEERKKKGLARWNGECGRGREIRNKQPAQKTVPGLRSGTFGKNSLPRIFDSNVRPFAFVAEQVQTDTDPKVKCIE